MENTDILLARMEDLSVKAVKIGCAASRFLTPAERANVAASFARRHDVTLSFDGGFEGAERARAVFLNSDWGVCDKSDLFAGLKVSWRSKDTLGHRDILGAIMALGIERDTIGDITAEPQSAALICLPEMSEYIADNLSKAGRTGISISKISIEDFPAKTEILNIKTATVSSLRLDAVLCAAFGLSRSKASQMITSGLVSLSHEPCLQPTKEVAEEMILSARGLGRAKVMEIGGISRKDRIFIKIGIYSR